MVNPYTPPPTLLRTKTLLPVARAKQVKRERLIQLLADANRRPLTLIIAAAGCGKTTLLSQWLAALKTADQQVAWVSLDEFDNEPARFWGYICEALSRVYPVLENGLSGLGKQDVPPADCPLITKLINEVSRLNFAIHLILDDYHVIVNQKIHQALEYFLRNLPPNLKVVIASRVEPPFSIARLRANDKVGVLEIKVSDLLFNLEETNTYLNQVMDLSLSLEGVKQLTDLTWGWIAGLQFAAVSLSDRQDVDDLLARFRSGNRYILDYLFDEVFNQQDEAIKNFLLKTSILDNFNPSLCDTVTGDGNSKQFLDVINRANLFVIVLDEAQEWYRYHPLFSNLLRRELSTRNPERVAELHRRASAWYEEHGLIEQAINHSLVSRDHDQIERLLQKDFWMAVNLVLWGDHFLLNQWLDEFPEQAQKKDPSVIILKLWGYIYRSRFDEANAMLLAIQKNLQAQNNSLEKIDNLDIELQLKIFQICSLVLQGDYARSLELAKNTIDKVDKVSIFYRCNLLLALGESTERLGDTREAYSWFSEAVSLSELAGETMFAPLCTYEMGRIQAIFGNLNQAQQLYEKGLKKYSNINKIDWQRIPAGLLQIGLGRLRIEWNQLELAELDIRRGISLLGSQSPLDWFMEGQVGLAMLKQAKGEYRDALEILTRASHSANTNVIPRGVDYQIYAELSKLYLHMDDTDHAKQLERKLAAKITSSDTYYTIILKMLQARICLSERKYDGLLENLELQFSRASIAGFASLLVEIMVLKAITYKAIGEADQAYDQVKKLLTYTQQERYIYSIVKENEIIDLLIVVCQGLTLKQIISDSQDPFKEYTQEMLEVAQKRAALPTLSGANRLYPDGGWIEQLTKREMEILRLAAKGADRKEIAQKLFITANTMKTHLRNIYGKLGVHSLSEAVTIVYQFHLH